MKTEFCTLTGGAKDKSIIEKAGSIIRSGGLVAFPTETVYGLGGDALQSASAAKIYEAKGRPSDNPLIVHICSMDDLGALAAQVPRETLELGRRFWPGPLTMILKKSDLVPYTTTGGLDTVAVRMPSHRGALDFIAASGGYVAAPSANLSGRPSPTDALSVLEDMDGRIDMILDGGAVGIGLESTIVDLTEERPAILRPGYIGAAALREVLGDVIWESDETAGCGKDLKAAEESGPGAMREEDLREPEISGAGEHPRAPGMKYRHYAPRGEMILVKGEAGQVARRINEMARSDMERGEKAGILATLETLPLYEEGPVIKCAGSRSRDSEIASALFRILREFDREGVKHIYSEMLDTDELGDAIMNRLIKAAGHRIMEV